MPKKKPKDQGPGPLEIEPLEMHELSACILGTTPLIFNRMSVKVWRDLIWPPGKKTEADKRANLKHDPLEEFRMSMTLDKDDTAPTRILMPSPAFKGAMCTTALETGGAKKASMQRLLRVAGYSVRVWGVPQMFMSIVRLMGIGRPPDVRTRAIIPEWATMLTVRFPVDSITPKAVANLLARSGELCGVGDFRQEKGKGDFGLFSLVNQDNADFQRIIAEGGREAQDAAIQNPTAFDSETAELWQWFEEELITRGVEGRVARVSA